MTNRIRLSIALIVAAILSSQFGLVPVAHAEPSAFYDPNFQLVWERTDKPVEMFATARSYMWGPITLPNSPSQEDYVDSPGGKRTVQYFDKSRMEVNNPNGDRSNLFFVTNGLLVREMVSGEMQLGDNTFRSLSPSTEAVAGDPAAVNPDAPTYATFHSIASLNNNNPAPNRVGQQVSESIDKAGTINQIGSPDPSVAYARFDSNLQHNIANVFVDFLNQTGPVWVNGKIVQDTVINGVFLAGLPITEAYWTRARVGGVEKDVLVQLFERRALTYTPSNPPGFKVEMGNVGQHYLRWRYAGGPVLAGWSTSGTSIVNPSGGQFTINGINWYGFETSDFVARGLNSQNYMSIIDQIARLGYNSIRIPFSNQMWESNPVPSPGAVSACPACQGLHSRDIMALIVNYAGLKGLHVILDNHRSEAGDSAEQNGLWYNTSAGYTEQGWIADWVSVLAWENGVSQNLGAGDTVAVNHVSPVDGFPIVLGFDLRNEPHSTAGRYLTAGTWGTGDGISPAANPNPNPFAVTCLNGSTPCVDWRLAAERAADTVLGQAATSGWDYPLIFVEGVSDYPVASATFASGPFDRYWWGGNLLGVNGNAKNPGAPVVLNEGGSSSGLGKPVYNQLVYSAHDFGPSLYKQSWFNAGTSFQSLVGVWSKYWAHLNLPEGVNPVPPAGSASYPWGNTGHTAYTQAPVYIGEFGTGNADADLTSSVPGSEGQWFTDMVNFIKSSYSDGGSSGIPVSSLHWSYFALNGEDAFGLLTGNYAGLANANKEYTFLCSIQTGPPAIPPGTGPGQCGSGPMGPLPAPR